MRLSIAFALLAACSYTPPDPSDDDTTGDAPTEDAPAVLRDIPHVPAAFETVGTTDLILVGNVAIDTTALTVSNATPQIDAVVPDPAGPEIMLIRVRNFEIGLAKVHVTGTRPLVILADKISLAGTLDVSGSGAEPGPGGSRSGEGSGLGGDGVHAGSFHDGGGGGGAYTLDGGRGGAAGSAASCTPVAVSGTGGVAFAADALIGGGAGGRGSASVCERAPGGGGGGAVQLSAWTTIEIAADGVIDAGGGGGGGGVFCAMTDAGAGSGGGAGGLVFIDAPTIEFDGIIGASGGGGGGGADGDVATSGNPGTDADVTGTAAAGGSPVSDDGAGGGSGAAGATLASPGAADPCGGNGGGGGGSAGQIVMRLPMGATVDGAGMASPAITSITY